jgi:hypothetical protein
MSTKALSREERLVQLRAWAQPPYHMANVMAGFALPQKQSARGIASLPQKGLAPAVQPGGAVEFHNSGDAPPGTTVSKGEGDVLGFATVRCVFWGAAWDDPKMSPGVKDIFAAVAALSDRVPTPSGSYSYFDGLSAYSGGKLIQWGFDISGPPLVIPADPPANPFSLDTAAQQALAIHDTPDFGPANVSWNLVVLFMPPHFKPDGPDDGEHSFVTDNAGNKVNFAYVSYFPSLDDITYLFSHELIESLTDPHGDAWQVDPRDEHSWREICDVCASQGVVNGVTVTSYFSSTVGACIIPSPAAPPLPAGEA